MARSRGRRRKPRARRPGRIAACAAVPLIIAGGVAAVRLWDIGGEAAVTSPPPAAFTAQESAARSYAGGDAPSAAEAASDRAAPRAVAPTPSASARPRQPEGADEAEDGKKKDAKSAEPKKTEPKKTEKAIEPAESAEGRAEHPVGGRSGGDASPGGEPGETTVLQPADGGTGAGEPGLRLPDIIGELGGGPGRTEPTEPTDPTGTTGSDGAASGVGSADDAGKTGTDVKDTDEDDGEVLAYFRRRWGKGDAAMKKVKDIRILGGYLRVYTKLPDTAVNSKHAVKLCERARDYLAKERGVRHPVVFVHARAGLNGHPVLANDLGKGDRDCRLTTPRPGRGAGKRS